MNTMSRATVVAATVALLVPAMSRAGTVAVDDNPCVKALMATLAETYHPAPRLRSVALYDPVGSPLEEGVAAEWTLTAVNPRTNLPVARVSCITDAVGKVVEFRQEPVL